MQGYDLTKPPIPHDTIISSYRRSPGGSTKGPVDKLPPCPFGLLRRRCAIHSPWSASLFRYFNSSPEVIRLVVMMYVRFPLSRETSRTCCFERGMTSAMKRCGWVELVDRCSPATSAGSGEPDGAFASGAGTSTKCT